MENLPPAPTRVDYSNLIPIPTPLPCYVKAVTSGRAADDAADANAPTRWRLAAVLLGGGAARALRYHAPAQGPRADGSPRRCGSRDVLDV